MRILAKIASRISGIVRTMNKGVAAGCYDAIRLFHIPFGPRRTDSKELEYCSDVYRRTRFGLPVRGGIRLSVKMEWPEQQNEVDS